MDEFSWRHHRIYVVLLADTAVDDDRFVCLEHFLQDRMDILKASDIEAYTTERLREADIIDLFNFRSVAENLLS